MPRSAAPAAAATAVLLLVCVAAISHLNERSRRAELAELSKLASFDRWGIPIDEAVDNAPGPGTTRAARKAATDKSMLKVVQELEDKMDTLSAKVNALDAHGATRHAVKQPVQKQAVRVVRDGASEAEMSALKTIDADIQRLIAVDTARASSVAQRKREPRQEDSRKEADEGKEVSKERAAQRLERKALELKEVEQRTMEAVKDAMARQRAFDLKEAAAESERRRSRPRDASTRRARGGRLRIVDDRRARARSRSRRDRHRYRRARRDVARANASTGTVCLVAHASRRNARARRVARSRSESVESAGTSDNGCDLPARNVRSFTVIRHTVEIGDDDSRRARSVPAEIHSRFGAAQRGPSWCGHPPTWPSGRSWKIRIIRFLSPALSPRALRQSNRRRASTAS